MKRILLALVLLQVAAAAHANEYGKYDLKNVITLTQSASGQHSATFNFSYLDPMISDLASHAGSYPPRFDSPDDLRRAKQDVTALSQLFDTLLSSPSPNPQLLLRAGVLNGIGHNLDVDRAGERAVAAFSALLKESPDDSRANYLYGKFLAEAGKPADALPFLEKAKMLGAPDADYTLGMTYILVGEKAKALENLELYAKRVPNDANAAKLIAAIRSGNIQSKRGAPP